MSSLSQDFLARPRIQKQMPTSEETEAISPTDFIELVNQTLDYAYASVLITGEVASYKVNQGKWVFFDLKDENASISCFMPLWDLRIPIEDGMKIVVRGTPKITKWGKFSFTVTNVQPVGEGSLKKAFELLKKKLTKEGLFDSAKKRALPKDLGKIGVISSVQAAGYADFVKIINARWGGLDIQVAHTQVQGMDAPDQIIRALNYFNERGEVQVIAILRGGGSADDLACFNDEKLTRAIAASKIPIITGIGHEVDESLADLAADVRASTPSNAAEMLTKDRKEERIKLKRTIDNVTREIIQGVERARRENREKVSRISAGIIAKYIDPTLRKINDDRQKCWEELSERLERECENLKQKIRLLEARNPERILAQGYAILSGKISPGSVVKITTFEKELEASIEKIKERNQSE